VVKRIVILSALAAILSTPLPAAAVTTLVFDVDVTARWDGAGPFTPFSFQHAWDISTTAYRGSVQGTPPDWSYYSEFAAGTAAAQPSPMAADMASFVGLVGGEVTQNAFIRKRFTFFADAESLGDYYFNIQEEIRTFEALGSGLVLERYLIHGINSTGSFPVSDMSSLDDMGISALLSGVGTMNWYEWAQASIHDTQAQNYRTLAQVDYFGRATFSHLVSGVPEPSTWLFAIIGIGFSGGILRRQRSFRGSALRP
jgi:hypothetical protein